MQIWVVEPNLVKTFPHVEEPVPEGRKRTVDDVMKELEDQSRQLLEEK